MRGQPLVCAGQDRRIVITVAASDPIRSAVAPGEQRRRPATVSRSLRSRIDLVSVSPGGRRPTALRAHATRRGCCAAGPRGCCAAGRRSCAHRTRPAIGACSAWHRGDRAWPGENARTLLAGAAARLGVGAAPAESPPTHARTALGMCGKRPANRNHGRGVRPHPLRGRPWRAALTSRDRVSIASISHRSRSVSPSGRRPTALRARADRRRSAR
jgi:hypothetical protein